MNGLSVSSPAFGFGVGLSLSSPPLPFPPVGKGKGSCVCVTQLGKRAEGYPLGDSGPDSGRDSGRYATERLRQPWGGLWRAMGAWGRVSVCQGVLCPMP